MFSAERKLISMSTETDVLRALLRLARRRTPPTIEQVLLRVRGEEADIRLALRSLADSGLVQRGPLGLRLSMAGFAVAVACASLPRTPATRRTATPKPQSTTKSGTDAAPRRSRAA